MSERRYTPEQKSAALADVLILGPGATAAKHGVPIRTLFEWRTRNGEPADLLPTKREHIGYLVATYLEANLQALTAQAYVASQPDYIERQPADGLAILHGVMADKSVRLLEALHSASDPPQLDAAPVYPGDTD